MSPEPRESGGMWTASLIFCCGSGTQMLFRDFGDSVLLTAAFVRENRAAVEQAMAQKGCELDLDWILELDSRVRRQQSEIAEFRRQRNEISEAFRTASAAEKPGLGASAKAAGTRAVALERSLEADIEKLNALLLRTPNLPWSGAPVGPDERFNTVVRTVGEVPRFDFTPLDHVALMERHDWADLKRITKVSGARTYCLKGRMALLEQSLMLLAQRHLLGEGFTPITVPAISREKALVATGHFPGGREDAYEISRDEIFLAGTGEVALTSLHSGEILDEAQLPILYAGLSPCFRREAGSAGRDVRGLLRVHQFTKVEQYVLCRDEPEESAYWHGRLLGIAEDLLAMLELPYRVIEASTGDMGLGKFRMNDIETWVPSLDAYRETHSCSTLHSWQARRANLRFRNADGEVRFVHTLNNTALASPRILVPLIENHQQADGRVRLPRALHDLMGNEWL